MEIEEILEFIQSEIPQGKRKTKEVIKCVYDFTSAAKKDIDYGVLELLEKQNYEKTQEYINMSRKVSDVLKYLEKLLEINSVEINDEMVEDKVEDESDIVPYDNCISASCKRINYEDFRVDESVPYDIMSDFCYKKPAAFSIDGEKYSARLWKSVLLKTCELLYEKNKKIFEEFPDDKFMQGKTRVYFSENEKLMSNPELIKGTKIFVETNLSANGIRDLIVRMLDQFRIPHAAYKIYLSKDLNPLHMEESSDKAAILENMNNENMQESIEQINMQDVCDEYDPKTEKCMNEDAPNFVMECCKKASCLYRKKDAEKIIDYNDSIYVLSRKQFKSKKCIKCGANVKGIGISVTYKVGFIVENYNLHGCQCLKCNRKYITRAAYNSFMNDTMAEDITTKFIFNQLGEADGLK